MCLLIYIYKANTLMKAILTTEQELKGLCMRFKIKLMSADANFVNTRWRNYYANINK